MVYRLFISHDHYDKKIAKILSTTITRITLGQIDVWFSSDNIANGGMQPGIWLDQVRSKLAESKAIIPLLTKRSIVRPWLLFETGYGASRDNCPIIPISIGLDSIKDIPFPLAMYQIYNIAGYDSFRDLMDRILKLFNINFDEEMSKSILQRSISEIVKVSANQISASDDKHKDTPANNYLDDIKDYIDNSIVKLENRLLRNLDKSSTTDNVLLTKKYSIEIIISFKKLKSKQYVEINSTDSVQRILDKIYYMIQSQVNAFKYLQKWILKDMKRNKYMIIREVAERIPAQIIFDENSKWEVLPLDRPYSGLDSDDYSRWY